MPRRGRFQTGPGCTPTHQPHPPQPPNATTTTDLPDLIRYPRWGSGRGHSQRTQLPTPTQTTGSPHRRTGESRYPWSGTGNRGTPFHQAHSTGRHTRNYHNRLTGPDPLPTLAPSPSGRGFGVREKRRHTQRRTGHTANYRHRRLAGLDPVPTVVRSGVRQANTQQHRPLAPRYHPNLFSRAKPRDLKPPPTPTPLFTNTLYYHHRRLAGLDPVPTVVRGTL